MLGVQRVPGGKVVKARVHLDTAPAGGDWQAEVDRLAGLGATPVRHIDERPEDARWIIFGPEGNESCGVRHRPAGRRRGVGRGTSEGCSAYCAGPSTKWGACWEGCPPTDRGSRHRMLCGVGHNRSPLVITISSEDPEALAAD